MKRIKTFFEKNKRKLRNVEMCVTAILVVVVIAWVCAQGPNPLHMDTDDGIERIDLDTIYLEASGVEVNFSEVILSDHNETRKLIVSTQTGQVSTELTDRLIEKLDFDFLKKTQSVSYNGTGYFVVDLDDLTAANVIQEDGYNPHWSRLFGSDRDQSE